MDTMESRHILKKIIRQNIRALKTKHFVGSLKLGCKDQDVVTCLTEALSYKDQELTKR